MENEDSRKNSMPILLNMDMSIHEIIVYLGVTIGFGLHTLRRRAIFLLSIGTVIQEFCVAQSGHIADKSITPARS